MPDSLTAQTQEEKLLIELDQLLPHLARTQDGYLKRLETNLKEHKGILLAHLKNDQAPDAICLHYDPNLLTRESTHRIAEQAAIKISQRYKHAVIPIKGMDCSDCAVVVQHSLERIEGVMSSKVDYASQLLSIEFDRQKVDQATIHKRIHSLGYQAPDTIFIGWCKEHFKLLLSLLSGAFLLFGWLAQQFLISSTIPSISLYASAMVLAGWETSREAWHSLKEKHLNTDILMLLAAIGAIILGDFFEGALLLFLFSLGHALEEKALDRARTAIHSLSDLAPKTATVRRGEKELKLPLDQIYIHDLVIIRPGERIAIDGEVLGGHSLVNQAPVTGESLPIEKIPGEKVYAGTINGNGVLEVRITRLAKDSTLRRIIRMVEDAKRQKSPSQQMIERFSRYFVPLILGITILVMFISPFFGLSLRESFMRGITLLVASSPCALALGTPATILAGIAQASRNGVLIKGGVHLENLGKLKVIAFDKTGTLTQGKPIVTEIVINHQAKFITAEGWSAGKDETQIENYLLTVAAAVGQRSNHPLAQAIENETHLRNLAVPNATGINSLTGSGLTGQIDNSIIMLGSANLIIKSGIQIPDSLSQKELDLQKNGKSIVYVAVNEHVVGLIALADMLRQETRQAVLDLHKAGIQHTVMLTGDNELVAASIARQASMSDYLAGLMPEDKLTAIDNLRIQYQHVAMVGDGINDAPALANATIGIAMGGAGSDVALETADIALMGNDLSKLPFAIGIGRAAQKIIIQNLFIAIGVIVTLGVAALAGLVGISSTIILHEGSTILVVLNGLRLLKYKA
jgi:Cd2+/Zn2+-exporting ATPase